MSNCADFNYDSCVCRECIRRGQREETGERPSCYRTDIIKNLPNMMLDEMKRNYEKEHNLKDSGDRREFETGAVRDMGGNKGRCDLLPASALIEMDEWLEHQGMINVSKENIYYNLLYYLKNLDIEFLRYACYILMYTIELEERNGIKSNIKPPFPTAILRLSKHYEAGSKKYGDRNWQKGIPISVMLDSGIRHTLKYLNEQTDEDHLIAALWNVLGAIWMLQNRPEMMDLGEKGVKQ